MAEYIFGAADSPCSANSILLRTADDDEGRFDLVTTYTPSHNFYVYVDYFLKSVPTQLC